MYLTSLVLLSGAIIFLPACSDHGRETIKGHGYVDLGLSVKWATCNVGADSPEEYGNYYAWGEIATKKSYTEDNSATYEVDMGDIAGNSEYDAARANWRGTWRLPLSTEIDELIENCTWTWTMRGEAYGYNVRSTNGNSIFLPAAGYRDGSSLEGAGSYGNYWSSTPDDPDDAYCLYFDSDDDVDWDWNKRYVGLCVRPVSE